MDTPNGVVAATDLATALTRYMNWRGIGTSAADLIPAKVRNQFALPPGTYMVLYQRENDIFSKNTIDLTKSVPAMRAPSQRLISVMVRMAWSKS